MKKRTKQPHRTPRSELARHIEQQGRREHDDREAVRQKHRREAGRFDLPRLSAYDIPLPSSRAAR